MDAPDAERLLYDVNLAYERIQNRTKDFYGIRSISDLLLNEQDFVRARQMHKQESHLVFNGNSTLTSEGFFRAIVYCLLTPMQNYTGQVKGFGSLVDQNLELVEENISDEGKLAGMLKGKGVLFHQQKAGYIIKARYGQASDLLPELRETLGTSRDNEVGMRKQLIGKVDGLGMKTGSLLMRMCGSDYVVPLDSWMMEMLYFHGYPTQTPRSRVERVRWETLDRTSLKQRKRGLSEEQYLAAEGYALDLASRYGVPGHILQLAFWTKKSSFNH